MLESRSGIIMLISQVFCKGAGVLSFRKSLLKASAEWLTAREPFIVSSKLPALTRPLPYAVFCLT